MPHPHLHKSKGASYGRSEGLIAHVGASKISRDQLVTILPPEATDIFKPIAHSDLIGNVLEALSYRHINVVKDEYAVSEDGEGRERAGSGKGLRARVWVSEARWNICGNADNKFTPRFARQDEATAPEQKQTPNEGQRRV